MTQTTEEAVAATDESLALAAGQVLRDAGFTPAQNANDPEKQNPFAWRERELWVVNGVCDGLEHVGVGGSSNHHKDPVAVAHALATAAMEIKNRSRERIPEPDPGISELRQELKEANRRAAEAEVRATAEAKRAEAAESRSPLNFSMDGKGGDFDRLRDLSPWFDAERGDDEPLEHAQARLFAEFNDLLNKINGGASNSVERARFQELTRNKSDFMRARES